MDQNKILLYVEHNVFYGKDHCSSITRNTVNQLILVALISQTNGRTIIKVLTGEKILDAPSIKENAAATSLVVIIRDCYK